MSLDNTDSVLQTDNDGELLVQTSDDSEEFVVIPAPRRRAVTVSAFVILLKRGNGRVTRPSIAPLLLHMTVCIDIRENNPRGIIHMTF